MTKKDMTPQDEQGLDQEEVGAEEAASPQSDEQPVAATDSTDELTVLQARLQRLAAEFDNYRRRTEDERRQLIPLAQAKTLLELTPVLDNFRRATEHLPEELKGNNWVTGVLYVEKQLEQIFEQFGVKKIKTIGQAFDPKQHEAIETVADETVPADHIIAEVESGYTLNGTVLKPAKVKVSSGPTA